MSDTCDHVTKRFKTFEYFLRQNKGSRNPKRTKNALFWYFFDPSVPPDSLVTTTIDPKVEHHAAYLNTLPNFYNRLYFSFEEVRYAGNGQN